MQIGTLKLPKYTLEEALVVAATYCDVPVTQLSEDERLALVGARHAVSSKGAEAAKAAFSDKLSEIVFSEHHTGRYEVSLHDATIPEVDKLLAATKPPEISRDYTKYELEDAIVSLYGARVSVAGAYEAVKPALTLFSEMERRAVDTVKAVMMSKTEWRGEVTAEFFIGDTVAKKLAVLSAYAQKLKIRLDTLQAAYEMASRLVTIMVDTPADSRVARADKGGDPLDDLLG